MELFYVVIFFLCCNKIFPIMFPIIFSFLIAISSRKLSLFSVQFSSAAQLCLTLWDPMNRNTPGLPVHHQLPWFTQTDVHRVGDAIQPSHPLSSPFPSRPQSLPASGSFPMSRLFPCRGQSTGVSASASVLPMNTPDLSPLG